MIHAESVVLDVGYRIHRFITAHAQVAHRVRAGFDMLGITARTLPDPASSYPHLLTNRPRRNAPCGEAWKTLRLRTRGHQASQGGWRRLPGPDAAVRRRASRRMTQKRCNSSSAGRRRSTRSGDISAGIGGAKHPSLRPPVRLELAFRCRGQVKKAVGTAFLRSRFRRCASGHCPDRASFHRRVGPVVSHRARPHHAGGTDRRYAATDGRPCSGSRRVYPGCNEIRLHPGTGKRHTRHHLPINPPQAMRKYPLGVKADNQGLGKVFDL